MEVKGNFIVQGSYIDIHDNGVVNLSVDKTEVRVNGNNIKSADASVLQEDRNTKLVRVIESCKAYITTKSAWSVVFCVCRDYLNINDNVSEFERLIGGLSFTKKLADMKPKGDVQKAINNHPYMKLHVSKWVENRGHQKFICLAQELIKSLSAE